MVLFGFLWFFSRLIFSSHRWGMMKISFPWWKPPPSIFDHDLHVARIDFLCFLHVFRSCLWFFMVLFCFLWFFNRLIFSSHRWGVMKFSCPWWKPPPSDFRHHLTCGPNRFSVFFECFSQLLMVFHGLFGFLSFSTVSFFHHIVGGWWKSRFLDEDRLRHTVEKSG